MAYYSSIVNFNKILEKIKLDVLLRSDFQALSVDHFGLEFTELFLPLPPMFWE